MNTQAESLATNTAPRQRPVRVDALDGLRAIAVVAVVLYHADPSLLPGGFLGVDLFFVLSGYLITSLIWLEHQRPDGFGLREFWFRRMRRLWPLAWVTLAAIAVASLWGVWGLDRQRSLPKELLAGFIHLANWYQIDHGGYVQSFTAPSPVRHFWSLAIEEQFYLVWPALLALLWRGNHPRGRLREDRREEPKGMWTTWAVLGCLILASLYAGWRQADHLDRAYLGSDVRAVALLVGATMAVAGRSRPFSGAQSAVLRRALGWRWPARRSSPCVWCIGRAHEFRLATERRLRNRRDRCRCGHGSSAELQSALSFDWVATSRSFRKTVLCALPRALAAARRYWAWAPRMGEDPGGTPSLVDTRCVASPSHRATHHPTSVLNRPTPRQRRPRSDSGSRLARGCRTRGNHTD